TQPLTVRITNSSGAAISNAPVTFSVTQAGGALSATNGGPASTSLSSRTDANGEAVAYYLTPTTAQWIAVQAQAGFGSNIKQVTFTLATTDVSFPFVGLKLWLRGDAGVVANGTNAISKWVDGGQNG